MDFTAAWNLQQPACRGIDRTCEDSCPSQAQEVHSLLADNYRIFDGTKHLCSLIHRFGFIEPPTVGVLVASQGGVHGREEGILRGVSPQIVLAEDQHARCLG